MDHAAKRPPPEAQGLPTDYDQMELSEWGLDWGDISLIRERLKLSPIERLKAAQDVMNTVLRIREQNGNRDQVRRDLN